MYVLSIYFDETSVYTLIILLSSVFKCYSFTALPSPSIAPVVLGSWTGTESEKVISDLFDNMI
jgi:hypothetical protein